MLHYLFKGMKHLRQSCGGFGLDKIYIFSQLNLYSWI